LSKGGRSWYRFQVGRAALREAAAGAAGAAAGVTALTLLPKEWWWGRILTGETGQ